MGQGLAQTVPGHHAAPRVETRGGEHAVFQRMSDDPVHGAAVNPVRLERLAALDVEKVHDALKARRGDGAPVTGYGAGVERASAGLMRLVIASEPAAWRVARVEARGLLLGSHVPASNGAVEGSRDYLIRIRRRYDAVKHSLRVPSGGGPTRPPGSHVHDAHLAGLEAHRELRTRLHALQRRERVHLALLQLDHVHRVGVGYRPRSQDAVPVARGDERAGHVGHELARAQARGLPRKLGDDHGFNLLLLGVDVEGTLHAPHRNLSTGARNQHVILGFWVKV
mmetsp:Transcript_899/g.3553  ORF Transcript_899/g.3553 Transcript_899/m.3553 type:complete len:281 (-) Transcript_899:732-1574(-)